MDEPFSALDVLTAETLRSEVYRLWSEKEAGLRSVLMITHTIEEAVFLGDRIILMDKNPGRVRQIIKNELKHPREYRTAAFQKLVEQIHDVIVGIHLPDVPPQDAKKPADPRAARKPTPLPAARPSEITGLVEILHDHNDSLDLFEFDAITQYQFGHTIAVTKAAELLGFVTTPGDEVLLTELGKKYLACDTNERKSTFRERCQRLATFQLVVDMLRRARPKPTARRDRARAPRLTFPNEPPEPLFQTILSWGRYGEIFGFEAATDELTLLEPATTPPASPPS